MSGEHVIPRGVELRRVPLLEALGREHLEEIARLGRRGEFGAGQIIFQQGDRGEALFIIASGLVRVFTLGDDGSEATIALLSEGESLGELALIDGGLRSASAMALEATSTVTITRDDFRDWLERTPAASLALLETLSARVRRTNQDLTDLVLLDLSERLARRLLALADAANGESIRMTQAELGVRLGVTREAVNKQLRALERTGALTLGRGSITVRDVDALWIAASLR
jgi:CRP-like cAMP-binding protein